MQGARRNRVAAVGIAIGLASTAMAGAADPELQEQMEALQRGQEAIQRQLALEEQIQELKSGQEAIRQELAEIKRLLQAAPANAAARPAAGPNVAGVVFDLGDNPMKGSPEATLTLVEFTDYQCPYCGRYTQTTYPQIVSEYVDTGKLRYALLDLPLETIHPQAFKAAEASHCAAEQDKFWEMHDRLFANQRTLEPWSAHAEALELDTAAFDECMSTERHAAAVRHDMSQAQKAGATGTPSFVLAETDPDDSTKVTGIAFIRGAQPFDAFKAAIDDALSADGS